MSDYMEFDAVYMLDGMGIKYLRTGSREICDPPVMDTDVDIVALDVKHELGSALRKCGYKQTTPTQEGYDETDFITYRNGEVNLIVVHDKGSFSAWIAATAAAKQLNIKSKKERVRLFQGVLYGNWNYGG